MVIIRGPCGQPAQAGAHTGGGRGKVYHAPGTASQTRRQGATWFETNVKTSRPRRPAVAVGSRMNTCVQTCTRHALALLAARLRGAGAHTGAARPGGASGGQRRGRGRRPGTTNLGEREAEGAAPRCARGAGELQHLEHIAHVAVACLEHQPGQLVVPELPEHVLHLGEPQRVSTPARSRLLRERHLTAAQVVRRVAPVRLSGAAAEGLQQALKCGARFHREPRAAAARPAPREQAAGAVCPNWVMPWSNWAPHRVGLLLHGQWRGSADVKTQPVPTCGAHTVGRRQRRPYVQRKRGWREKREVPGPNFGKRGWRDKRESMSLPRFFHCLHCRVGVASATSAKPRLDRRGS
jgi:hypothetical protein